MTILNVFYPEKWRVGGHESHDPVFELPGEYFKDKVFPGYKIFSCSYVAFCPGCGEEVSHEDI